MGCPVNIGIVVAVVTINGINHTKRLLGGGPIVQIRQRPPIDLLIKYGEIPANRFNIEVQSFKRSD
jgi:hypothetical protein